MLEGKRLYVDFVEINPPLIMYLSMIPAELAKLLAVNQASSFNLSVWTLTLLSALLSVRILTGLEKSSERAYVPALIVGLGLAAWLMSPLVYFGEREHISMLLIMPFFFLRWVRQSNGTVGQFPALLSGLAAGVGCCIKPYFLLLPAVAEFIWLLKARDLKILLKEEVYCAMLVFLLYGLHFLFLPEQSRHYYFSVLVPLTVQGYEAYNHDLWKIVTLDKVPFARPILVAVVLSLSLFLRKQCSLLLPFAAWTVAAYLIFVLQRKGFHYHTIPMRYGLTMLIVLEAMALLLQFGRNYFGPSRQPTFSRLVISVFASVALISALFCAYMLFKFVQAGQHNFYLTDILQQPCAVQVLRSSREGDPVFFFDTGGGYQYPLLVQLNRRPGSRFMDMSPFAMARYVQEHSENDQRRKDAAEYERSLLRELAEDFESRKTRLVLIPEQQWALPSDFSVFQYLQKKGFIQTALRKYKQVNSTCEYRVFERISD